MSFEKTAPPLIILSNNCGCKNRYIYIHTHIYIYIYTHKSGGAVLLISSIYKILARVLANKLKSMLSKLLPQIIENKSAMLGVLCKSDLEKTYDHFNWILFALPAGNVWFGREIENMDRIFKSKVRSIGSTSWIRWNMGQALNQLYQNCSLPQHKSFNLKKFVIFESKMAKFHRHSHDPNDHLCVLLVS